MKSVTVIFGPNDTIDAIIKLKNFHDVTSQELSICRTWYNILNNREVPKVGVPVKIPIMDRHLSRINELS